MGKNFRVLPIGLIGLKKSNLPKSVAHWSHCCPLVTVAHWSHPLYIVVMHSKRGVIKRYRGQPK